MGTLFGTDGVRGLANRDLTADLALDLAAAAAHVLGELGELHAGTSRAPVPAPSWAVIRAPVVSSSRPPRSPAWPARASTSSSWASCRRPPSPT